MINANKIKGRLRECGMTQNDLAGRIGLSPATVNQKINGQRPLLLSEAEQIALALGIEDAEFGDYFFNRNLRSAETQ